jgi:acetyltransferase-like isoleucine patch superfamily enzyme
MKHYVSNILTRVKGEEWEIDEKIPSAWLLALVTEKIVMYLRGLARLRRFKQIILLGKRTTLRCRSLIKFEGSANIDRDCIINALSMDGIRFGKNVSVGKYTTIECSGSYKNLGKGLIVGNNVGLGTHGFLGCAGGITIGNDVICGNFISMHSENHIVSAREVPIRLQGVTRQGIKIGNNCWIGAKATILDGAKIGDGCIVAAGAVVTKGDYAPNSIIGGVPAKVIKMRT